jgi:AraC family transcriptional regulator of adaptative response / DNA-3-methyladenine glycosylase II
VIVGVVTTGIYCREGCPAPSPKPENVREFASAADAAAAGLRACKRCKPLERRLAYDGAFDWDHLLTWLAHRAIPGVESVEDGVYRRTVRGGFVELAHERRGHVALRIPPSSAPDADAWTAAARHLLDLDADMDAVSAALGDDPVVGSLTRAFPGTRVPGCWDGFELAVRAVLGQQVSVKGASTTAGRLAESLGESVDSGRPELNRLFPTRATLAERPINGMPAARAHAIARVAAARALDRDELVRLPGIGPWTAEYVAMRALKDADAYPDGDLGLRKALATLGADDADPARWSPYRAYAAMLLWRSLSA